MRVNFEIRDPCIARKNKHHLGVKAFKFERSLLGD